MPGCTRTLQHTGGVTRAYLSLRFCDWQYHLRLVLRVLLGEAAGASGRALCGRQLPLDLLVAAVVRVVDVHGRLRPRTGCDLHVRACAEHLLSTLSAGITYLESLNAVLVCVGFLQIWLSAELRGC